MLTTSSIVVERHAVQLLMGWITQEAVSIQSLAGRRVANFGGPQMALAAASADPDGDNSANDLEFLVGTSPWVSSDPWRISAVVRNEMVQIRFPQIARRGFEVQATTNLFDPDFWRPLDMPGNRPFSSSKNFEAVVEVPFIDAASIFYRLSVFEQLPFAFA